MTDFDHILAHEAHERRNQVFWAILLLAASGFIVFSLATAV